MPYATVGGVRLHHRIVGSGPPLVLVHANRYDGSMFERLASRLATDFTVVVYDQRDAGLSGESVEPYDRADLADELKGLLDALDIPRAHVLGTSLGGGVAQAFAVGHVERCDRLVLVSTFDPASTFLEIAPLAARRAAEEMAGGPANARRLAELAFPDSYLDTHPDVVTEIRDLLFPMAHERPRLKRRRGLDEGIRIDISDIMARTLVVAGADDQTIPPGHTLSLAMRIPRATAAVLPGVGHTGVVQAPDDVAALTTSFLHSGESATEA